eukprot:1572146-Pyramimonas_sp.AAC.1
MVPDGPRAVTNIEDGLQTAPEASKTPQEASKMRPKRASRRKKIARSLRKTYIFSHVRLLGVPRSWTAPEPPKPATR